MGHFARIAFAAALAALASPALAQSYPTRSITLIVPFAPGGPADVLGRMIGQKMGEDLGQQVVIENRASANALLGAQVVARAKPDGYTLLLAIDGILVMNPFLYSNLSYNPFKDFEPVSLVAMVPSAITANIKVPADTLQQVIDIEKAKPRTFQIGVSTPTSQVAVGLINMQAGINLDVIPYRGGTTQITATLAGDIPLGHESVNVALPLYREKKIKILAITGQKRLSLAPEIPIVAETLPGFDMGIWQSVVVPTGTPRDIVMKLHATLTKVMASEDLRNRLIAAGIEPTISKSPEDFAAFIKSQAEVREKVIKAVGMKLD